MFMCNVTHRLRHQYESKYGIRLWIRSRDQCPGSRNITRAAAYARAVGGRPQKGASTNAPFSYVSGFSFFSFTNIPASKPSVFVFIHIKTNIYYLIFFLYNKTVDYGVSLWFSLLPSLIYSFFASISRMKTTGTCVVKLVSSEMMEGT